MALLCLTNENPGIYCLLQTRLTLTAENAGEFWVVFFFFRVGQDSNSQENNGIKKEERYFTGEQVYNSIFMLQVFKKTFMPLGRS